MLLFLLALPAHALVVADPPRWDVAGQVAGGTTIARLVTVTNQGDEPVEVLSVIGSDDSAGSMAERTLPPGGKTSLSISARVPITPPGQTISVDTQVMLILDSRQDRLTIPIHFDVAPGTGSGPVPIPGQLKDPYQSHGDEHPVNGVFFFNGGCPKCQRFVDSFIKPLDDHFGDLLTIKLRDIKNPVHLATLEALAEQYAVDRPHDLNLFVGKHALIGRDEIEADAYDAVVAETHDPEPLDVLALLDESTTAAPVAGPAGPAATVGPPSPTEATERRVGRMTMLGLLAAGLIDGINPCAFATAVFLIALLTQLGHDRRALLLAGTGFAVAVFVTYYLIGLGVLQSLGMLGQGLVAWLLKLLIAAVAAAVGVAQLADVRRLQLGMPTRALTVQTPLKVKQAMHRLMRSHLSRPAVVVGAMVAGALVTLLEAVCTGQIYVPTLALVANNLEYRQRALGLLAAYNLGFVLPLLVVLALAYRGVTSEQVAGFARRHLITSKLALALLLFLLAAYLVVAALVAPPAL